jgi:hypothetical protein
VRVRLNIRYAIAHKIEVMIDTPDAGGRLSTCGVIRKKQNSGSRRQE